MWLSSVFGHYDVRAFTTQLKGKFTTQPQATLCSSCLCSAVTHTRVCLYTYPKSLIDPFLFLQLFR